MRFFSRADSAILLVCTANICRSPMAEGLLGAALQRSELRDKFRVESAGTHASQLGKAPDVRAQRVCLQHGIDIRKCRSRQVRETDFEDFDFILAMDSQNFEWLLAACPVPQHHKISRVGAWGNGAEWIDIPDPYFGNEAGFTHVFNLLQVSVHAFVGAQSLA